MHEQGREQRGPRACGARQLGTGDQTRSGRGRARSRGGGRGAVPSLRDALTREKRSNETQGNRPAHLGFSRTHTHQKKQTKKRERAPRDRLGETKVFATSQLAELFFIASKKTARLEQWQREGRKPTQRRVPSPHFRRGLLPCPKEAACLLTGRHHAPDRPCTEPRAPWVCAGAHGRTAAGPRCPDGPGRRWWRARDFQTGQTRGQTGLCL